MTATRTATPSANTSLAQADGTGERIIDALADVIVKGGLTQFSVQEVADRANVSHRTVYRKFPTRKSLLDGLIESVGRRMESRGGIEQPESLDSLPLAARANSLLFSRDARSVEAGVRFAVGSSIVTADQRRRTDLFRDLVADGVPHIALDDIAMAGTLIRYVAGSRMWLALRESGLDAEAAAQASTWAVTVLIDALRGGRTPSLEPLPASPLAAVEAHE